MNRLKKMLIILFSLLIVLIIGIAVFINQPSFGRNPKGNRLDRIQQSPHYKDGQFQNELPTTVMTGNKGMVRSMWEFLAKKKPNLRPDSHIPSVKTDLKNLPKDKDYIVWFGHSSYLLQLSGRRILVDPTLISGSPVSFFIKSFEGTNIYKPQDMPDVDFLVISHDHWDHLDYQTVKALQKQIKYVVTPLGIGEHFEYWGFPVSKLTELDWYESANMDDFKFHCLPARHFSGRGLVRNKTLWGSFIVQTPDNKTIYIGGDSGYSTHFKQIGEQYPNITLAILENGQYDDDWNQIHTMPKQLAQEMKELGAQTYVTVHHSKYVLSNHAWDAPLVAEKEAAEDAHANLQVLTIGQPYEIK